MRGLSMPNNLLISIVSPVYKAEDTIEVLVEKLAHEVTKISEQYEIILVEDGSPDRTWEIIKKICAANKKVKAIALSRNFGQHKAIIAGLEQSRGNYVAVMDCDLQDNPQYIPEMYKLLHEKRVDYVLTRKKERNQSFFRKYTGKYFFKVYNWIADNDFDENIGGFCMLSREVVNAYLQVNDYHKFFLPILSWIGFKYYILAVQNDKRYTGKSSYNIKKLLFLAFDAVISNSERLLKISIITGMFFMMGALLCASYLIVNILLFGRKFLIGWPSLIVVILFCSGIILFNLGIMGIYIGKIFEQVKGRPRYLIKETLN
jgi:dolichol-phosphate mannosyltransferase